MALVVEELASTAGLPMDSEGQLDEVSERFAFETGLLGEELQVKSGGELGRLPGEEQPAEQVQGFGGFGLFKKDPKVAALVSGVFEERLEPQLSQGLE